MAQQAESLSVKETIARGKKWYEQLGPKLELEHRGQFLIINVETGEYVLGDDELATHEAFDKKFGNVPGLVKKIGEIYPLLG